jgi:predicted ester cyclase
MCADDFVDHDPIMGDQDREGVKRTIGGYRQAFPDIHIDVLDVVAADDKVVYRWQGDGTFENEFMGQQPTGEKGDPVNGITIDRFEGGKIVESWSQWDVLTLMRDIGVMPEGAAAAAGG